MSKRMMRGLCAALAALLVAALLPMTSLAETFVVGQDAASADSSDGGASAEGSVSSGTGVLSVAPTASDMPDITAQANVRVSARQSNVHKMLDGSYRSYYESGKVAYPSVKVMMEGGPKAHGVYIRFANMPAAFDVMELNADETWTTVYQSEEKPPFLHVFVPLTGADTFRIRVRANKQTNLTIAELTVFGAGDVPAWVQRWKPTPEKAELLVLSAHPDDEVLFFGGTIPTYAGELGRDVIVAYMTFCDRVRRSELLDCLWTCGVRTYPVIGSFGDTYSVLVSNAYKYWNGKKAVEKWITALFRQYKPEVVVTHDLDGEYGHGAHKATAAVAREAFAFAADAKKFPDSAKTYGVWQVKKLYLHLYAENAIEMDWDKPLSAFGGKTGFELALAGFQCHNSQLRYDFVVEPRESAYSCYRFGLAESVVGADVAKDDFFENVTLGE